MKKMMLVLVAVCGLATAYARDVVASASFVNPQIQTDGNLTVNTGPGVYYNDYYGYSWLFHYNGASYMNFFFNKSADQQGCLTLFIAHLSSLVDGTAYSPINISINGTPLVTHYVPNSGNWIYDEWGIDDYLSDGQNIITISLCNDAIGNYWINTLRIYQDDVCVSHYQTRE